MKSTPAQTFLANERLAAATARYQKDILNRPDTQIISTADWEQPSTNALRLRYTIVSEVDGESVVELAFTVRFKPDSKEILSAR